MNAKLIPIVLSVLLLPTPTKTQSRAGHYPFDSSKSYTQKLRVVRRFIQLYGRPGVHRVYIAKADGGDGHRYLYAYWREGRSMLILHHFDPTFDGTKETTDYWWLEYKARINLRTDVVPTEDDIAGSSYLVDKPWTDRIVRACVTTGRRITMYRSSRSPARPSSHAPNKALQLTAR